MQQSKGQLEGQFVFIRETDQYIIYKVLHIDPLLVRAYWPLYKRPDLNEKLEWEIQTACTSISPETLLPAIPLGLESVNTQDLEEITRYQAIKASKIQRVADFKTGFEHASALFKAGNYSESILKINEIAPYHKLNLELYRLRGIANFRLGQWHDARFDLRYYVQESGEKDQELLEMIQYSDQQIKSGE